MANENISNENVLEEIKNEELVEQTTEVSEAEEVHEPVLTNTPYTVTVKRTYTAGEVTGAGVLLALAADGAYHVGSFIVKQTKRAYNAVKSKLKKKEDIEVTVEEVKE